MKMKNYFTDDQGRLKPINEDYVRMLKNDPAYLKWLDELDKQQKERKDARTKK